MRQLIQLSLVVDDFAVKYMGKEHAQLLVNALKEDYTISETGKKTNSSALSSIRIMTVKR